MDHMFHNRNKSPVWFRRLLSREYNITEHVCLEEDSSYELSLSPVGRNSITSESWLSFLSLTPRMVREGMSRQIKKWPWGWRTVPAVWSTGCSSRGFRFNSQHPIWQLITVTLVLEHMMPSSGLYRYCMNKMYSFTCSLYTKRKKK